MADPTVNPRIDAFWEGISHLRAARRAFSRANIMPGTVRMLDDLLSGVRPFALRMRELAREQEDLGA